MTESAANTLSPTQLMPLFSNQEIPYTGMRDRGRVKWFSSDSERHYMAHKHLLFGPDDIEYSFNKHGYRCIEFAEREAFGKDHLHLVTVGESHALGQGLPEHHVYGYLVARKLEAYTGRPVQHWNLSQAGASAEFIARVLPSALAVLRPNFVILNFPNWHRREYIFADGNYVNCGEGDRVTGSIHTVDRHDAVKSAHFEHAHDDSNKFNLWKLFVACQRHLLAHKTMWVGQVSFGLPPSFNDCIAMRKIAPRRIMQVREGAYKDSPELLFARDGKHAGIGPHADLAEQLFGLFLREYTQEIKPLRVNRKQRTG